MMLATPYYLQNHRIFVGMSGSEYDATSLVMLFLNNENPLSAAYNLHTTLVCTSPLGVFTIPHSFLRPFMCNLEQGQLWGQFLTHL